MWLQDGAAPTQHFNAGASLLVLLAGLPSGHVLVCLAFSTSPVHTHCPTSVSHNSPTVSCILLAPLEM